MLVALERGRRPVHDVGEPHEHRTVERVVDLGLLALEQQGEPRGVQDLDREPAPDLDLLLVERRVDPQPRARRPVAHRVRAVLLEVRDRGHDVALGLRHLLALGVQDEPADRRVGPRELPELQMRLQDGVEQPGPDDLVGLGPQVHREHAREQVRVLLPLPGDLRGERGRRPRVHDVRVTDEAAGPASLLLREALGARPRTDRPAADPRSPPADVRDRACPPRRAGTTRGTGRRRTADG